jgi:hypothetical protein
MTVTTGAAPDYRYHDFMEIVKVHLPCAHSKEQKKRISVKRQDPKQGRPREDAHGNSTLTEEMLPHPDRSDSSPGHGPSPPVLESLGPRRGAPGAPGGATGLGAEWNLECHAVGNDPQKGLTV